MPISYLLAPSNYRGALPFGLYLRLQQRFPQAEQESGDFESGKGLKLPWQVSDFCSKRPLTESSAAQRIKTDFAQFYFGEHGHWANQEILR